jgi:hypothetical protein
MLKLLAWTLSVWVILFTPALFAQSHLGGLRGRVSDSTGASVAQAKVTLVNQDSNSTISTVSNDQGEFAFASLNPGTYRLMAEMTGFKKFDRPNLLIETQGFTRSTSNSRSATLPRASRLRKKRPSWRR